jgi:hypothetical protein
MGMTSQPVIELAETEGRVFVDTRPPGASSVQARPSGELAEPTSTPAARRMKYMRRG